MFFRPMVIYSSTIKSLVKSAVKSLRHLCFPVAGIADIFSCEALQIKAIAIASSVFLQGTSGAIVCRLFQ